MNISELQDKIDNIDPEAEKIMEDLEKAYCGESVKNKGYLVISNANKILELDINFTYLFSGKDSNLKLQKINSDKVAARPEEMGIFDLGYFISIPTQEWAEVKYDYGDNMWRIKSIDMKTHYEPRGTWGNPELKPNNYYITHDPPRKSDSISEEGNGRGLGSGTRIWLGSSHVILTYLLEDALKEEWIQELIKKNYDNVFVK